MDKIRNSISLWFKKNRENHFFRQNRTAYTVWVSEVALQQTRLQAAMNPLKTFLNAFANLESLANAEESEVLFNFRGLGYYNRARNLHKGAKYIVNSLSGEFPSSYVELLKVPSIGEYTAAAISSIQFAEKRAVIDGNVNRVVSRINGITDTQGSKDFKEKIQDFMNSYIECDIHAGDLNEGIMEFGQKICTIKKPSCSICTISDECSSFKNGATLQIPNKPPKRIKKIVNWNVLFVVSTGRVLMQKFGKFYFYAGMWGFPSQLNIGVRELYNSFEDSNGLINFHENEKANKAIKHTITNHSIIFASYITRDTKNSKSIQPRLSQHGTNNINNVEDYEWVKFSDVENYLVVNGMRKVWKENKDAIFARGGI